MFVAFIFIIKLSPRFLFNLNKKLLCALFRKFGKKHSRIIDKNLEIAFPGIDGEELAALKGNIYNHFATIFLENIYLYARKKPQKILKDITVNRIDILESALKKEKGIILFSGHFGNWELIPYILSRHLQRRITSIAREMNNPLVERVILKFREYMGSDIIYKKGSMRTILNLLKKNNIVLLLIDQNTVVREGVFVDFFSQKVSAVTSVSQLHLKKKIPIVPAFLHYEKKKIVLDILDEIQFNGGGNHGDDVKKLTQECTTMIEHQIRQHPEQWFWFHNRWKTKPPEGRRQP
jgi:KDO2-lipid IV(A) lauroyltransferase